jgi:hypothetical protein
MQNFSLSRETQGISGNGFNFGLLDALNEAKEQSSLDAPIET